MLCLVLFEIFNWFWILHFSLVYTWQWLIIVAVFAWIAAEIILKYSKNFNLNIPLLLSLILVSVCLDAFWDIFHFYANIHNYDKFLHFFNSWVITYLVYAVLKEKLYNSHFGKFFNSVILITIGSFFWTLYEIEEFLEDLLINHRQIRLWDWYDTAWDLTMNVLWCVLATLMIIFLMERHKSKKG